MANMTASGERSVLKIREFLGLNENPDGDTRIQPGELSELRNFRITADRHLQLRPGQKTRLRLRPLWDALPDRPSLTPRLTGVWTGPVNGREVTVVSFGGVLWELDLPGGTARARGRCTQDETTFFGFSGKLYLLNGHEYLSWDGGADTAFAPVEGYIPTLMTASPPGGGGVTLERVNRLTSSRRARFSPDGKAVRFQLPEREVDRVVSVTGTAAGYSLDKKNGAVTFKTAPAAGVNTLAIVYKKGTDQRKSVENMRFSELYNGVTDTRVFLYGDGTNRCLYSGTDFEKGAPTADYFPELSEAAVGGGNSPLTGMIRHYDRLLAFQRESAWALDPVTVTIPGGVTAPAFNVTPVNREIGCEAPGQVRILENNPLTLSRGALFQWKPGGLGIDYRSALRISDRVQRSLSAMDFSSVRTFNHRRSGEFWLLDRGEALILNYRNDSWYRYTNVDFAGMTEAGGRLYGLRADGSAAELSRAFRNDDGIPIDALAETGAMDFDRDWMLKYSPVLYVALQPESGARILVSVETNRRSDYPEKAVSAGFATFSSVDFRHFSFSTNRKPQVRRVRLRVKRATFYKLKFRSCSASAAATVLETDIRLRTSGNVK